MRVSIVKNFMRKKIPEEILIKSLLDNVRYRKWWLQSLHTSWVHSTSVNMIGWFITLRDFHKQEYILVLNATWTCLLVEVSYCQSNEFLWLRSRISSFTDLERVVKFHLINYEAMLHILLTWYFNLEWKLPKCFYKLKTLNTHSLPLVIKHWMALVQFELTAHKTLQSLDIDVYLQPQQTKFMQI